VSPGRTNLEPLDGNIAAVTRRFWWPVYAEFRDNGQTPESSLHLCHQVIADDPIRIANGLRNPKNEGRLRRWIQGRTVEVLEAPEPSRSGFEPVVLDSAEAEARDSLRWETRIRAGNPIPSFQQRWAHVLLETALDKILLINGESIDGLELDGLLHYLDRPLPESPVDDFEGWIRTPQILSLKGLYWRELRRATNQTITDPRLLDRELLELFPPR
jgi:hypothetical protein